MSTPFELCTNGSFPRLHAHKYSGICLEFISDPIIDNHLHFKSRKNNFNCLFFLQLLKIEFELTAPSFAWKGPGVIIAEEIPEQVLKGIYFHAPI